VYRKKDSFYRRAKASGYRSRAAYKLLELDRAYHLLRPGDRVLDLGCAPGGWLQVAAAAVGPKGRVVGVDIEPVASLPCQCVRIVFGNLTDEIVRARAAEELGGLADVVLSDMAPKLTGIRERDEVRADELVGAALAVADELLRPGGRMVVKLFSGRAAEDRVRQIKQRFERTHLTRTDATRKGSAEFYAVGVGFRRRRDSAGGALGYGVGFGAGPGGRR